MTELLEGLPEASRKLLRRVGQPEWMPPMLATLTPRRFSSPDWIFERKLDGERCLAYCWDRAVRLFSRNRRRLDGTYPEIVDWLQSTLQHGVVLDGEVVAFEDGRTSFARLQRRLGITDPELARRSGVAVFYYVFDILHLDGYDLTSLPVIERKQLLRKAVVFRAPVRFTPDRRTGGEAYLDEACRSGWEGLIAKRAASPYVPRRSTDWLKLKCVNEQEFVIGGFTDPMGTRIGFGALLIGYHEAGRFVYAGKVGTGYDVETLRQLRQQLDRLEQDHSPFSSNGRIRERGVHWVRPRLVAQVAFTEWTNDGRLRHPRFLGLRDDKPASEVVRERGRDVPI